MFQLADKTSTMHHFPILFSTIFSELLFRGLFSESEIRQSSGALFRIKNKRDRLRRPLFVRVGKARAREHFSRKSLHR